MFDALLTKIVEVGITNALAYIAASGGVAAAFPVLLEMAKRWERLSWINRHSDAINRGASIVFALVASLGFSLTWNPETGDVHVLGVTVHNLARLVVELAGRFGLQELVYRRLVKGRV